MRRIRVYVDTSIIGGPEDAEFAEASRRIFERIVNYDRIHKYNSVNVANRYPLIEIHSPLEMANADED